MCFPLCSPWTWSPVIGPAVGLIVRVWLVFGICQGSPEAGCRELVVENCRPLRGLEEIKRFTRGLRPWQRDAARFAG